MRLQPPEDRENSFSLAKILSPDYSRPRRPCRWTKLQSLTPQASRENIFSSPTSPLCQRNVFLTFSKPVHVHGLMEYSWNLEFLPQNCRAYCSYPSDTNGVFFWQKKPFFWPIFSKTKMSELLTPARQSRRHDTSSSKLLTFNFRSWGLGLPQKHHKF